MLTEFAELIAEPGERHNIYGTTGSGKSCLIDWQTRAISEMRPDCMQVLVDTKPRFRAQTERVPGGLPTWRRDASWRYEHWRKGPVVPNSVRVDLFADHPFRGLWTKPGEVAIMQGGEAHEWARMLQLLMSFTRAQLKDRERHVTADEVLDFYGRNTWSIRSKDDVFYLIARAGRERNIGETLGSQRVKGMPILVRNMMSRTSLFHLDEESDMAYLRSNGINEARSPEGSWIFRQWRKQGDGTISPGTTHTLELPDSYLSQLAA